MAAPFGWIQSGKIMRLRHRIALFPLLSFKKLKNSDSVLSFISVDPERWTSTSGTGKSVPVSALVEGKDDILNRGKNSFFHQPQSNIKVKE
jgi:hypothetical protein